MSTGLDFELTFRGSVNRWECDENDHLNVRFFVRKTWEAIQGWLGQRRIVVARAVVTSQHMRFIAEARIATPMSGYCAVVELGEHEITLLTELRHTLTGNVLTAFVTVLRIGGHALGLSSAKSLPAHGAPRGVAAERNTFARFDQSQALAHGFKQTGAGVIGSQECGATGRLPPDGCMGRMSDSMPNLWSVLHTEEELDARSNGFEGGAVVEYRMEHHSELFAGDSYCVVSGLTGLGDKTQHMVHLMFNQGTGQCVLACTAVGVVMDLEARKAVSLPPERRARMAELILPSN